MKTKIVIYIIFIFFACSKYSFSNDLKLENKINKNLRCLICQGQSIYDSQSDFAESMKLVVKQKIESGVCHYCGGSFSADALTMDHIVPISRGGKSTRANLVPACKKCNSNKKYYTPAEIILREKLDQDIFF